MDLSKSVKEAFAWMFLPQNFPQSVSDDYVDYQIWDTLQGFMGYFQGIIRTLSFLKGLGVGQQDGTLYSAMIIWLLRDITGVISGLCIGIPTFTEVFSDKRQLRQWRIIAEIISIFSGFLEIYAAFCQHHTFMVITCVVVILNTAAGIMQNQSRVSLITHFAKTDNISDCAAKEANQDRGVKVFGIPLAFFLLSVIGDDMVYSLVVFGGLIALRLFCNIMAVRALKLKLD